jgi:hypothetical protein
MTSANGTFICSTCGKSHEGLPTDSAYTLPDVVWAIPETERAKHAKWSKDLCQFGERYFFRCVLAVPFKDREGDYGWGVWAEVKYEDFDRYYKLYDEDGSGEPEMQALLANAVPAYDQTLGLPILVQLQSSTSRPSVRFPPGSDHLFALEQAHGIGEDRYHQILQATGALQS